MLFLENLLSDTFYNTNGHSLYLSKLTHLSSYDKIIHEKITYVLMVDEHSQSILYLVWELVQGMN